jgi:hypothetical protein
MSGDKKVYLVVVWFQERWVSTFLSLVQLLQIHLCQIHLRLQFQFRFPETERERERHVSTKFYFLNKIILFVKPQHHHSHRQ